MRPSSLGGGRILRRTLSVPLSVRPVIVFVYFTVEPSYERTSKIEKLLFSLMDQRHVCTFRHAQRAAYRTAISAAQILVYVGTRSVIKFSVPGGKYRTDFRYFRCLIVNIRYFSVLWIPTSVSVSVFQNIGYRFGISVYRPKTIAQCCVLFARLPSRRQQRLYTCTVQAARCRWLFIIWPCRVSEHCEVQHQAPAVWPWHQSLGCLSSTREWHTGLSKCV